MKVETKLFIVLAVFFVPVGLLYGIWTAGPSWSARSASS